MPGTVVFSFQLKLLSQQSNLKQDRWFRDCQQNFQAKEDGLTTETLKDYDEPEFYFPNVRQYERGALVIL